MWLQLEEKQIPYVLEKINMRCYGDKPATFLSKVCGRSCARPAQRANPPACLTQPHASEPACCSASAHLPQPGLLRLMLCCLN